MICLPSAGWARNQHKQGKEKRKQTRRLQLTHKFPPHRCALFCTISVEGASHWCAREGPADAQSVSKVWGLSAAAHQADGDPRHAAAPTAADACVVCCFDVAVVVSGLAQDCLASLCMVSKETNQTIKKEEKGQLTMEQTKTTTAPDHTPTHSQAAPRLRTILCRCCQSLVNA